jgi:hypothetical protein
MQEALSTRAIKRHSGKAVLIYAGSCLLLIGIILVAGSAYIDQAAWDNSDIASFPTP